MRGDLLVHVIWISGKRMIAQGSNGLSRGDNSSRVMARIFFPQIDSSQ